MAGRSHLLFLLVSMVTYRTPVSLMTTLTTSAEHCQFPATMYLDKSKAKRDDNNLKWYIHSANPKWNKPHHIQMVDIDEDKILIHHGERPFDPEKEADVTYACIEQLEDSKYLVTKQQKDKDYMYQCLQFVVRSDTVVQWKFSAESEVHSVLLCDDHSLKLEDAPLLYYRIPDHWEATHSKQRNYNPCPLEGGYFISQWGNATHDSTCRDDIPPSKLESECGNGNGLRYHTGRGGCPSPFSTTQNPTEQLYCIATWEEGPFTFSIVVSKGNALDVSCMRYPTNHGHSFTAHVFTDSVCNSENDVAQDPKRRSITMSRHIETTLCSDDTQACASPRLNCNEVTSKSCRESCDVCPKPAPWGKPKIPKRFRGKWLMMRDHITHEIEITNSIIDIPIMGKYRVFDENSCVTSGDDASSSKERLIFITNFENGCGPRLTAMEMMKRSDAVISLRFSEDVPVNYTVSRGMASGTYKLTGWRSWCHLLHFSLGPIASDDSFSTDTSGWYNFVNRERTWQSFPCSFPQSMLHMRLALTTGVNCTIDIIQTEDTGFRMKLDACKSDITEDVSKKGILFSMGNGIQSPIDVVCLASFTGREQGTQYFITRVKTEAGIGMNTFLCWALRVYGMEGYLLPVSDCDDNSFLQIDTNAQHTAVGKFKTISRMFIRTRAAPSTTPEPPIAAPTKPVTSAALALRATDLPKIPLLLCFTLLMELIKCSD